MADQRPKWRKAAGKAKRAVTRSGSSAQSTQQSSSTATEIPVRVLIELNDDRLVPSPVFVMSSVRSGSTLLRVIMNSHPQICAPHEMHLRTLKVDLTKPYIKRAMAGLGFDQSEIENTLRDAILNRILTSSGKSVIVDKTPGNLFVWEQLGECWPDAKYIFLLRHPGSIVDSLMRARADRVLDQTTDEVRSYLVPLEAARNALPGLTIKYEDLTADPEQVTRQICEFVGVEWDPSMLNYGEQDHGDFKPFIGDWSSNIKSGSIQAAREVPSIEATPKPLQEFARVWGYD